MTDQFNYEYPLGKFIRSCLKIDRLQTLLVSGLSDISYFTEIDHRNLLIRVLELHSLVSRPELKNELIAEIEKRLVHFKRLRNVPHINRSVLDETLQHLNRSLQELKSITADNYAQPLPYIIDSYQQRTSIPGGQFEFDLPAFQHWLYKNKEQCHKEILHVLSGFNPIIDTMQLLLNLLRQSGTVRSTTADNGIFELTENNNYELIVIGISQSLNVYPEVSGSKHRVFIRFLEFTDVQKKPQQTGRDIHFLLTCCKT